MARHSIPTAKFQVFSSSEVDQAIQYVQTCGYKVVLKVSGLAAGKGVLIPDTVEEAVAGLRDIMVDNVFGAAGQHHELCRVHHGIESIFMQEVKLLLKNVLWALRCLFSLSRTVTLLSHYLPHKITNVSAKVMLGRTRVAWVHMLLLPLRLLRS